MTLHTFGVGRRQEVCSEILRASDATRKYDDLILLPIPSSRDKIHITGTEVPLESLLKFKKDGSLIAGYGLPLDFVREAALRGIETIDASADERFLRENAELTAHGTAGLILTKHQDAISDMKIGIIGYGRIGKILSRILLFLGARTVIFTRRRETKLELCTVGIEAAGADELERALGLDILINTAPAELVSKELADALCREGCELIDLASGNRLPDCDGLLRLPSIPDKMYPASAGRIYAAAILRAIEGGRA